MRKGFFLVVLVVSLWSAQGALAAGWCGGSVEVGADRPDVVTGQQVHAVVAIPADGVDTFPAEAARLADDMTSITTWWQGQDPSRVPRFDVATFGAEACADISFVRLPATNAEYSVGNSSASFQRVKADLASRGLGNVFKKYLVYYVGKVDPSVCGTGSGGLDGGGVAIVWLQECTDVPTDTIAAHELIHALGADPRGNPCPPELGGSGHPCDSTSDILYPRATGLPLTSLVLDVNHDDYYAHAGSWADVQDSRWLHIIASPLVALAVGLQGGPGQVTSDLPGVTCSAACTTQWDQGTEVRLTALPGASDRFVGWKGSCSGNGDCVLNLARGANATAIFGPLRIPVRLSVAGKGRISCVPKCGKTFPGGDDLSLRAVAATGWKFARWSGACKGIRAVCRPATTYSVVARAVFTKKR